jgi:hypothetical protein
VTPLVVQNGLADLAVDSTDLFAVGNSSLLRAPKSGTGNIDTLTSHLSGGPRVVLDNTYAYYASDGAILRIRKDAQPGAAVETIYRLPRSSIPTIYVLHADASTVYWAVTGDDFRIESAPKTGIPDGGAPLLIRDLPQVGFSAAFDATNIYVAESGPMVDGGLDREAGTIVACPKTGCASGSQTVVTGLHNLGQIAVDSSSIYWVSRHSLQNPSEPDTILRIAKP